MASGGLLQLAANGAQDKYLNYEPEISYFKSVYKSYTNFAAQSIRVDFERNSNLFQSNGNQLKVIIPRYGDLLGKTYLCVRLPRVFSNNTLEFKWIEGIGEHMIQRIQLLIGGQLIDQQYGQQFFIQNQLELSDEKLQQHNIITGNTIDMYDPATNNQGTYPYASLGNNIPSIEGKLLYIPLPLWFSKEYGKSLPVCALLYHQIELIIDLQPLSELYLLQYSKNTIVDYYKPDLSNNTHTLNNFIESSNLLTNQDGISLEAYLECEYIYLEDEERNYISKNPQDYLIETHYREAFGELLNTGIIEPKLSNLMKSFFIIIRDTDKDDIVSNRERVLNSGAILMNGLERVSTKPSQFYEYLEPYKYYNRHLNGVYTYSFSIAPLNKRQPAGAVNLSKLQSFQFRYELTNSTNNYEIIFYSEGYNFLRVISGMGALAFAQ